VGRHSSQPKAASRNTSASAPLQAGASPAGLTSGGSPVTSHSRSVHRSTSDRTRAPRAGHATRRTRSFAISRVVKAPKRPSRIMPRPRAGQGARQSSSRVDLGLTVWPRRRVRRPRDRVDALVAPAGAVRRVARRRRPGTAAAPTSSRYTADARGPGRRRPAGTRQVATTESARARLPSCHTVDRERGSGDRRAATESRRCFSQRGGSAWANGSPGRPRDGSPSCWSPRMRSSRRCSCRSGGRPRRGRRRLACRPGRPTGVVVAWIAVLPIAVRLAVGLLPDPRVADPGRATTSWPHRWCGASCRRPRSSARSPSSGRMGGRRSLGLVMPPDRRVTPWPRPVRSSSDRACRGPALAKLFFGRSCWPPVGGRAGAGSHPGDGERDAGETAYRGLVQRWASPRSAAAAILAQADLGVPTRGATSRPAAS
jgi:hypothetical protein